eukprot:Gb_36453 [translate_table: standard]
MYPHGSFRNPYPVNTVGDRSQSQPTRQPSFLRPVVPPQPQTQVPKAEAKQEVKQEQKASEAKKEQSSISGVGERDQPGRQPFLAGQIPRPQPQVPKQEVKDEPKQTYQKSAEARKNQFPFVLQEEKKDGKMIVIKDGIPDEEAKTRSRQNDKALQKEIQDELSNLTGRLADLQAQHKIAMGGQKEARDELGVGVITMAGENRGATMDLGSELRKQHMLEIHRGYKLNQDNKNEEGLDAISKGNARSKTTPVSTYVNSNVQGINNSILYNSSCPNRDPGVHLAVSNSPVSSVKHIEAGPVLPDKKDMDGRHGTPAKGAKTTPKPVDMRNASHTQPTPETLRAEPPVKRRCLRALFLESSSDSSPERSESRPPKPRRHGCRHQCQVDGKCSGNAAQRENNQKVNMDGNAQKERNKLEVSDDKTSGEKPKKANFFGTKLLSYKQG